MGQDNDAQLLAEIRSSLRTNYAEAEARSFSMPDGVFAVTKVDFIGLPAKIAGIFTRAFSPAITEAIGTGNQVARYAKYGIFDLICVGKMRLYHE